MIFAHATHVFLTQMELTEAWSCLALPPGTTDVNSAPTASRSNADLYCFTRLLNNAIPWVPQEAGQRRTSLKTLYHEAARRVCTTDREKGVQYPDFRMHINRSPACTHIVLLLSYLTQTVVPRVPSCFSLAYPPSHSFFKQVTPLKPPSK